MVVANLTTFLYAGNRRILRFTVTDEDTAGSPAYDLTTSVVKFALAAFGGNGLPLKKNPKLDFSSLDASPQVVITTPASGIVEVTLLEADTENLPPANYYFELEVFNNTQTQSVVVATGTLEVRVNVENV
jgi:hypothetical protein